MSRREPTDEEAARIAALSAEKQSAEEALEAIYAQDEYSDEEAEPLEAAASNAEGEIDRLYHGMSHWTSEVMAHAGVVVSIADDGTLNLTRGLIRPEVAMKPSRPPEPRMDALASIGTALQRPPASRPTRNR